MEPLHDDIISPLDADWLLFRSQGDSGAFGRLVRAFTDMVFSSARRITQDAALAEDVTQAVFLQLARKGRGLPFEVRPGPWCYRQAVRFASNVVRTEVRRRDREQRYVRENSMNHKNTAIQEPEEVWQVLSPILDEMLAELPEPDRDVIVARYFEKLDMKCYGNRMGISAEAAQKRVSRAMDRLRDLFERRGLKSRATVITLALLGNAVQAAPPRLASSCMKNAASAIPAGNLPLLLGQVMTKSFGFGLAAALLVAVCCGWSWRQENNRYELLTAGVSKEGEVALGSQSAGNIGQRQTTGAERMPLASIWQALEALHTKPRNLSREKQIEHLMGQISDADWQQTAVWVTDQRHYRVRTQFIRPVLNKWVERNLEGCMAFITEELPRRADVGGWSINGCVDFSQMLYRLFIDKTFDPSRMDAWCGQFLTGVASTGFQNYWHWELVMRWLKQRQGPAWVGLMNTMPDFPGRDKFLERLVDNRWKGWGGERPSLADVAEISDQVLRTQLIELLNKPNPSN